MTGKVTGEKRYYYRRFLIFLCCFFLCLFVMVSYFGYWYVIPSKIRIRAGVFESLHWNLPVTGYLCEKNDTETMQSKTPGVALDFTGPMIFKASQLREYQMKLKLFGIFPYKSVAVEVIKDEKLIPAGTPIGIYVKTIGPLVLGTSEFQSEKGVKVTPAKYILQPGDYILRCNGETVESKKHFFQIVKNSEGKELDLDILRNGEVSVVRIRPEKDLEGDYKLGVWIRDNAQGIGTLTYLNEEDGFGALGHGINDLDLSVLMNLSDGKVYHTDILQITKGKKGEPGELTGYISYDEDDVEGDIYRNSDRGIFGIGNTFMKSQIQKEALSIGLKQEIKIGKAQIISAVSGVVRSYEVTVEEINMAHDNVNKGIVLRVTDEELLRLTGGIICGMSGSPIIQDGKIIGAVTHVFVNDPTRGYGIFIEEMLGE